MEVSPITWRFSDRLHGGFLASSRIVSCELFLRVQLEKANRTMSEITIAPVKKACVCRFFFRILTRILAQLKASVHDHCTVVPVEINSFPADLLMDGAGDEDLGVVVPLPETEPLGVSADAGLLREVDVVLREAARGAAAFGQGSGSAHVFEVAIMLKRNHRRFCLSFSNPNCF